MRRLIMWNLMSLDGFIEGPDRDISWHDDVWGPELEHRKFDWAVIPARSPLDADELMAAVEG